MPSIKLTCLQNSVRTRLPLELQLPATPPIIPDSVMGSCFGMLARLAEERPDRHNISATAQAVKHACEVSMALALAQRDRAMERQSQVEALIPRPVLDELPWYRPPALGPHDVILSQIEYELPDITEDEEGEEQTDDGKVSACCSSRRAKRRRGGQWVVSRYGVQAGQ